MTLRRYLTGLIWLCIAPLLLLGAALAIDHVREVQARSNAEAQALVLRVAAAVDEDLRDIVAGLQLLAASPLADDPQQQREFHAEAKNFHDYFGGHVTKVDAAGHTLLLTTRRPFGELLPPPHPLGRVAIELAARERRPVFGDVHASPITHQPTVAVVVPGLRGGAPHFFLIGSIATARFADRVERLKLPSEWTLSLRDGAGEVITQRRGDVAADPRTTPTERFARAVAEAPWSVELSIPRAAHLAPMVNAAAAVSAGLALLTLAGVLGGGIAARRLTRAVQTLVVNDADPARRASAPEIDEIANVRELLLDATRRREQAETARRAEEERHRGAIEQASAQLQLSEARLRGIFDTASEGIITVDAAQAIVMINPAAARTFGYRADELLGQPVERLIPERLRERHRRALAAFGESGAAALPMSGRPPLPALHADGHEFPIEAAVSQLHVGGQRLYTVILRDVSERLRADEAIRTAKAKLDAALASMTDGLAIFDAADRLVEFNDAFAAYHRFASKDECLRTLTEYPALFEVSMSDGTPLPPQRWPARRALGGETGINVEFTIRRQDSGERWIGSYSFAPIRAAGGAIDGAVLVMRDVTALHTIHAELQASHAALRRLVAAQDSVQEAERKRVARELHDDLQQTLAAIKMDTVAIGLQLQQDPARVAPMLTKIDELATAAIASTRRIVNDLRPQMLEELGLLAALEALAADFAQRTGIDCRVDSDGDVELEPSVATCLYRVAQESLNNVLKHADARQVQIAIGCDGDRVRLNVRDDGKGLQATDRHKPHSFGLVGMAERVHAAGGSLRIDSAPARGTRVEVEVPAAAVDDELPIGVA